MKFLFPTKNNNNIDIKEKGRIDNAKPMLRNKKVGTIKLNNSSLFALKISKTKEEMKIGKIYLLGFLIEILIAFIMIL